MLAVESGKDWGEIAVRARIIVAGNFDIDATDDPAHGVQQFTIFHGYYEQNQYLPLLVFDVLR